MLEAFKEVGAEGADNTLVDVSKDVPIIVLAFIAITVMV
jgi:hypothetical protein